ncbi:ethylene-responsive transcription factor ERF015 [Prunus yedoensis var. nudiflora]|uniref:Ethylene-responsive transcription factor ERF015 n=1 Tax=Prunus yedoensis var. nudiflora TaxID=2094558 RepID=A0A315ANG6_PRUYE|nr:ethylene-responsive transcription factor ERF015 [Prunus yedoensis var. nudiflora]
MDLGTTSTSKKVRRERTPGRYKGVRMRAWGKWVSEIRLPKSGDRIWLGSYDAPDKAARAHDAAAYCIHGERAEFNFPKNRRPVLSKGSTVSLSKKDIQTIATDFSSADVSESTPVSSTMTTQVPSDKPPSPNLLVSKGMASAYEVDSGSFAPSCGTGEAVASLENIQLDDFLMLDTDWIADFY